MTSQPAKLYVRPYNPEAHHDSAFRPVTSYTFLAAVSFMGYEMCNAEIVGCEICAGGDVRSVGGGMV